MKVPFTKDSSAVLDYSIDWSAWLGTDTIATSTWTDATAGITVNSNSFTTTATKVWLSGGTAGQQYRLTNRITTAGGRTDDRTIVVQVQER